MQIFCCFFRQIYQVTLCVRCPQPIYSRLLEIIQYFKPPGRGIRLAAKIGFRLQFFGRLIRQYPEEIFYHI